MPKFFINNPVFAWVVAILISLGGVISLLNLGVESYPRIAPPQITVVANYPGSGAATAESTVTQVIEQQLTGIDHLLYFSSTSASSGRVEITLTFETGTDPDIAQVQVQNKVSLAEARLPAEVVSQGVTVAKAGAGFMMMVGLTSDNPRIDRNQLNDIAASRVIDQVARIQGVGSTRLFGSEYAMNVWLDPEKLQGYHMGPTAVLDAVRQQNVQFVAGAFGADPAPKGQMFTATVGADSRFSTPAQFEQVIIRANPDGSSVRLKDVARVEFGPQNYGFDTQWNGKPLATFGIQLLPGANALQTAEAVKAKVEELSASFPDGVSWFLPYETTTFIKVSIEEVFHTLLEAVVLVFLVMLVFLQNFRATIIPTLVIPVALLGTFIGLAMFGYTVNQLTMFALVLAIGIVVDDAIVVIENVERIMAEEKLPAKEATEKAMQQITGAVVAITVVLAAVFIPSALQSGAAGEIYKQFAVTIALAMAFSAFLALGFTPALCATMLKQHTHDAHEKRNVIFRAFESVYSRLEAGYVRRIAGVISHAPRWMVVFTVLVVLTGVLFTRVPTSFLPPEDQGYAMTIVQLPPGSSLPMTRDVFKQVREATEGLPEYEGFLEISGFSFVGLGENVGMGFFKLKPWEERDGSVDDFIAAATRSVGTIKGAKIFVVNIPTVQGLGQFGGFDMWLQDRNGEGQEALIAARTALLDAAAKESSVQQVRPNTLENASQARMTVDRIQAQAMGLSIDDIYASIQLMLAPVYANDFVSQGRIKRVNLRADSNYRTGVEALDHLYLPSASATEPDGSLTMIPVAPLVNTEWESVPPSLSRYNGYSAVNINGSPAAGGSSGVAMNTMEGLVDANLSKGFGYDWTGMSYQELLAGNGQVLLLILSLVIVFLCLAALYGSWSIPVSVLLVVPLGILGSVVFTMARGLSNDIFFQIGLITIIGLAAKNAILIVEFAVMERAAGKSLRESVISASRLRLRPILMTSFAFIMGVVPMAISSGAGANARHAIGTGVIGGMLFATLLGLVLIPVFFVVVRRMLGDRMDHDPAGK
ncbi:multidrug efflux RND transporter permease subunit [Stenotrophomonas lacuserhaii]|uniref:multidrug efflux RND transporter permease subunit n=1 Tax=Stenotrophomonas lacuserhaii TaxID=2760084 RepID=UPI0032EBCE5B